MLKRIECGIADKGRGIDYLSTIKKRADELEVVGVASLKVDGSIKVIAEGEEKDLINFSKRLEQTSPFYPRDNFYVIWQEPTGEFKDFSVSHNK